MIIAFPTNTPNQLESLVFNHFGSAENFVLVDLGNNTLKTINNADKDHEHGHCQPLKALGGQTVDAVAVGGIGKGALNGLLKQGIKVYQAVEGTIKDNLELLQTNKLPEFEMQHTCGGHVQIGGCMRDCK